MSRRRKKINTYKAKTYIKIPFGEIQYGHVTHRITIWIGTWSFHLWKGHV